MSPATLSRISQADQSFGRRLRRERERRKIALSSIAENTKISVSFFEDLERDDVSRWPSGIFRKSFIRAYAKAVGLDPDDTAREFLECHPDPNDPDVANLTPPGTVPAPAAAAAPAKPRAVTPAAAPDPSVPARRLSLGDRAMAVAWDAGIVITLGLLLDAVLGTLWMPLAVSMAIYFAGGILFFGSTPGASLQTPSLPSLRLRRSARSSSDESNSSSESSPPHRSDGQNVHPYQAPGT